jgi:CheY-like chemotaxis protein
MGGQRSDTQPKALLFGALHEALAHIHDPSFQTPDALGDLLGVADWDTVRSELAHAINGLKPPSDAPPRCHEARFYAILHGRFVHGQTQEVVAEELGLSVRHLRRQEHEAIKWLADRLQAPQQSTGGTAPGDGSPWMAQVRQELDALREDASEATCMVEEVLAKVVTLAQPLLGARGVSLRHEPASADLMAGIQATALKQVLLVTLDRMTATKAPKGNPPVATLEAEGDKGLVRISMTTRPALTVDRPRDYLVDEILSSRGGRAEWHAEAGRATMTLYLHAVRLCPVLVVEDNADLVHFYQRYVAGTPYRIVHQPDGSGIVNAVQESGAEIIVLDVMLPDIDGWELLTHLHQHPSTRDIPVLVCTVVRAKELAAALGAAAYLAKPVRRAEFIEALQRLQPRQAASASD